jgi:hypothetical protein
VGENLTYLWGIGSNGFGAGEAAGDSAGGGEGVTDRRPVRTTRNVLTSDPQNSSQNCHNG